MGQGRARGGGGKHESLLWGPQDLHPRNGTSDPGARAGPFNPQESRSEQRKCGQKGPRGRGEWEGARQRGGQDALAEIERGAARHRGSGNGFFSASLGVSAAVHPGGSPRTRCRGPRSPPRCSPQVGGKRPPAAADTCGAQRLSGACRFSGSRVRRAQPGPARALLASQRAGPPPPRGSARQPGALTPLPSKQVTELRALR